MRTAGRPFSGILAATLLLFALPSPGGAWADEAGASRGDWRVQAAAEGLTPSDVELLARQKVLIGVRSFNQVFSAYAACPVPVFVTSDSVLRAYNVLLEESLGRVERTRARELARVLRSIWVGLPTAVPADAQLGVEDGALDAAVRRAQVTIGTALRLLGEEVLDASGDVRAVIDEEVRLVEAGEGRRRPPWQGASEDPLDTLDYDRFRPRSFYVGDERLERYFRATAWLQDVPFHLQREADLLTVVVLQNAFGRGWERERELLDAHRSCRAFMRRYTRFLGHGGDPSIYEHRGSLVLHSTRDEFLCKHPDLDDETRWDADLVVHVLPRVETPDGRLLGRVFDARVQALHPRPLPGGLDLVAAMGSGRALAWRTEALGGDAHVPDAWPELGAGEDLFRLYLRAMAVLVDEADAAAPELFRGDAWAAKSANTVLAGWAQVRHAWALNVMDSQKFLGGSVVTPGWVEPEPEFFARLLDLSIATEAALRDADAFDRATGVLEQHAALQSFVDLVARLDRDGLLEGGYDAFHGAASSGLDRSRGYEIMNDYFSRAYRRVRERASEEERSDRTEEGRKRRQGATLREAALLAKADVEAFEEVRRTDPEWRRRYGDPLALQRRWEALEAILHRLEGLAVKELRGKPFDEDDATFLRGYAAKLAYPMLYDGNAYTHPPRDRPLVAAVFSAYPPTPEPRPDQRPQVLHAGTGMPCAIYVLWPHEGAEVLCRGGVVPYREVVEPTRLTDEQWRKRLFSKEPPPVPEWLQPITVPVRPRGK